MDSVFDNVPASFETYVRERAPELLDELAESVRVLWHEGRSPDEIVSTLTSRDWDPSFATWLVQAVIEQSQPASLVGTRTSEGGGQPIGAAQPPLVRGQPQPMPSLATHQVEYTAATFSPAVGCNPGDYWNADTLRRYLAILNDYGAKGWRLLDMDVIPFESGCWPFKQKGALYLMTFERTA